MNWELQLRKRASKTLRRFPREEQLRIARVLRELVFNPYSGDIVKLEDEENAWRRRVGDYRIFYEIRPRERTIFVFRIERRGSKTY